jgi:phosphatidylserine/phosphatidylglycerophosphate/cardiolipin synthase-like enzyme
LNTASKSNLVYNQKAFVSSANLSYNGIVNNLEIGSLITGKKVTALNQIFNEMYSQGTLKDYR